MKFGVAGNSSYSEKKIKFGVPIQSSYHRLHLESYVTASATSRV